jgi:Protein of unknown function (DUF3788)
MSPSVFLEKKLTPTESALAPVLGKSKALWDDIKADVTRKYEPITEAWGYSGKNHGWSLTLKQKKRSVLYLVPGEGVFRCSLAFSEKAVAEARHRSLPSRVMEMIETAKRYPEGRAVRIEVQSSKDAGVVKELVSIKMASL